MLSGLGHNKNTNNTNNPNYPAHGASTMNDPNYPNAGNTNTYNQPLRDPNYNSSLSNNNQPLRDSNYNSTLNNNNNNTQPLGSNISHTFDADKDRNLNRDTNLGTQQYGTGTTGLGNNSSTNPFGNDQLNRTDIGTTTGQPITGSHGHHHHGKHHGTTGTTTGTGIGSNQQYGNTTDIGGTGLGHTFDADKDRNLNRDTNLGTQQYGTGSTGLGTGTQPYGTTGTTQQPYGTAGTTQHPYGTQQQQPYSTQQQPYSNQQPYSTQQQPYSSTQQQPYGSQQQPYGTTGTGLGPGTKTMNTVESVTRDVQAQIDAQAEEAIRKSRELNAQDQARLQASIREATASLEEQARQLKAQIDQERVAAEQHVRQTQQQKLHETAQVQQMEEQKILEAAAQRKIALEQRAMKLQQEIDEIVRRKTEEMMGEKPGNLCFTHRHQDTSIGAKLAGDIGHVLDLKNSGRVTETTLQGNNVQYHPVQIQQQPLPTTNTGPQQPIQMSENTIQGQETHEKKGGFFHSLKAALTGHHDTTGTNANANAPAGTTSTTGVNTTGVKQQPVMGNQTYDPQTTWASNADKHMPQQQQQAR